MTHFELVLTGEGRIERREGALAAPAGSQVQVDIHVVGLCTTDLALHAGRYLAPHRMPICFGHEWAGVVAAVGADARYLRPGDHVTGECSLWCGRCDRCRRNKNMCRTIEKFGLTVDGAARRQILIEERHLHRASPALDMSVLALAEPLSVCAAGIVAAGGAHDSDLAAQRILVIGGGMIGSGCVLLLRRLFGCTEVFVHDLRSSRLARAAAFGAKALTSTPAAPIGDAGYGAIYSGDGFDVIIETSGSASAFAQALSLLNPGGTLAMLGFLSEVSFAPKDLVIKAGRLVGSIGGSGMFETVVPWLERHAAEARPLITHSLAAEHAERAFDIAADGDQAVKVQLAFR